MNSYLNVSSLIKFKNGRIDDGMMIKQLDLMMPVEMAGPLKATATKCAGERKFSRMLVL